MSSKSKLYTIILVIIVIIAIFGIIYLYNRGDNETVSEGTFVYRLTGYRV